MEIEEKELDKLWNEIVGATGNEQRNLFVLYCERLVQLKEEGKLTEEQASYKMVGAIQFDNLTDSPEIDAIFDQASIVELPREISHEQLALGGQNGETANQIKQKEWAELVKVIERTKNVLK